MKPAAHILAAAALLLAGGCSKKESAKKDASNDDGTSDAPPKISKTQPTLNNEPEAAAAPDSISRQADGLWHLSGSGKIFTGRMVYIQDAIRWEEKYEKGVRVFVRAWDEEGDAVELHAWNADGSPKN